MRWIVDESVSRTIVENLRNAGHDVLFVTELFPASPDDSILLFASSERWLLLTLDMDFGELLFRDHVATSAGVILLRMRLRSKPRQWARLNAAIDQFGEALSGLYTVIEEARIRTRPLG